MKYQLAIETLEIKVMLTEEKLAEYKEIVALKDYKKNIIVEGMVEMYECKIQQCNDAVKILKLSND